MLHLFGFWVVGEAPTPKNCRGSLRFARRALFSEFAYKCYTYSDFGSWGGSWPAIAPAAQELAAAPGAAPELHTPQLSVLSCLPPAALELSRDRIRVT
eukprot:2888456-Prymnesium_polylepis.1